MVSLKDDTTALKTKDRLDSPSGISPQKKYVRQDQAIPHHRRRRHHRRRLVLPFRSHERQEARQRLNVTRNRSPPRKILMPQKRKIRLNNISAVPAIAVAGVALIDVPLSFGRCHEIHIGYGHAAGTNTVAAALAFVEEIRVIVNGTVLRTMSGAQLRDQNVQNGSAYDFTGLPNTTVGVDMPIFFAEPWRKDVVDQDSLAWSSKPMNSFKIEVQLAANAGGAPTLNAFAVVDDVVLEKPAREILYCKWARQTFNGGSTEVDITNIDRRGFIQQVTLYPSAALTEVIVKKDALIISELKRTQNDAIMLHHGMLTVGATGRVANVWDVVFDHDDLLGSSLDMRGSRDFVLTLKSGSTLGSTTGIIQRVEPLD